MRGSVWLSAVVLLLGGCGYVPTAVKKDPVDLLGAGAVRVSAEGVTASEPGVARDASGAVFVVYVEHSDKNADVILQKMDAGGKTLGEKVRVNPNSGEAKAWKGDPPTIAIAGDNTIYIGWTRKYADENSKGNDLLLSASHDGGLTFGEPVRVNDDAKPASHGMHSLAIDKTGRIYLAWLDERNITEKQRHPEGEHHMEMSMAAMHHEEAEPNSEVFYSFSSDGGKTFAANKKISSDVCPCCKTTLLAADDGTIYAGWRQVLKGDHRHIEVARSTDAGANFSEGVVVSDDNWQIDACPVSGAALASPQANTIDVVWYTAGAAGQAGVYFTRSTDGGKSFEGRILISNEASSGTPVLLERDGKTTAVFQASDGGTITAKWAIDPTHLLNIGKIPAATVPTATESVLAFVRDTNGHNSVWLAVT